jgi:glutaredoxin 3
MNNTSGKILFSQHQVASKTGESLELVLFSSRTCFFCHRVLDWAHKLQIPLTVKDTREDRQAKKTLVSVGGKRQVPCLFINGKPLYESNDIIKFFQTLVVTKA